MNDEVNEILLQISKRLLMERLITSERRNDQIEDRQNGTNDQNGINDREPTLYMYIKQSRVILSQQPPSQLKTLIYMQTHLSRLEN